MLQRAPRRTVLSRRSAGDGTHCPIEPRCPSKIEPTCCKHKTDDWLVRCIFRDAMATLKLSLAIVLLSVPGYANAGNVSDFKMTDPLARVALMVQFTGSRL